LYDLIASYWPHILATLSLVMGTVAAIHATMTKNDVRAAIGWVGIILLSPILGALIYAVAGINRIRRKSMLSRRLRRNAEGRNGQRRHVVTQAEYEAGLGHHYGALKMLGDKVTKRPLTSDNRIEMFTTGDEAYAAICAAIDKATRSIILETYIFDRDAVGLRVADHLIAAQKRGVAVRVLIDAVGARYSVPSIVPYLREGGISVEAFSGRIITGLRLPYANLRTHRKITVIDGTVAFTGGMNIRAAFSGPDASRDTHFRVSGPIVADIFDVAADDWQFETGEVLAGEPWRICLEGEQNGGPVLARLAVSGPDSNLETNHKLMMGAFSVAERSILIMSPYFLPDSVFLGALTTAALRGVDVEIIVPKNNNLAIVARAMTAQFGQILGDGVRVFEAEGRFDHSKLMVIDGRWAFVGSSNLDSRSLRLNFETDMEIHDEAFARQIEARIRESQSGAHEVTRESLRSLPFAIRLLNRVLWLASPYI
jgi:cardiolipin synthase A/B